MRVLSLVTVAAFATPALAADKFDPRCIGYGQGFVYAESSGFCVKIGGEIDATVRAGRLKSGSFSQSRSGFSSGVTMRLDARKQTGFGPLRIFVQTRGDL